MGVEFQNIAGEATFTTEDVEGYVNSWNQFQPVFFNIKAPFSVFHDFIMLKKYIVRMSITNAFDTINTRS